VCCCVELVALQILYRTSFLLFQADKYAVYLGISICEKAVLCVIDMNFYRLSLLFVSKLFLMDPRHFCKL